NTPSISFKNDVLPIFRNSCALSASCHGCDQSVDPGCTTPGFKPFLGTCLNGPSCAAPTAAQITAIMTSMVNVPAGLQLSLAGDNKMVGNPDMNIITPKDPAHSFITYKLDGNFPMVPTSNDVACSTLTCA